MEEPDDATVIESSWTEPVRFGIIFDRHATRLRRYLVRRLGPDDGDNVLGDVFRIAFERRVDYDLRRSSAAPWLYGIATNLVARHRRREQRRLRAVARLATRRPAPSDPAESVSAALDAEQRWATVVEAVGALPSIERDTLVLAVWEELSYDDIAAALDIPVGTVRSRINRARSRLRELDTRRGEEPDESAPAAPPGRIGA